MSQPSTSSITSDVITQFNSRTRALRVRVAGHTEAGHVRTNNQDTYLLEYINDNVLLAAVADGMGGHRHGEYASQRATEVLHEELLLSETISPLALAQSVYHANLDIFHTAENNPDSRGMGTTLTTVLLEGNDCLIGHVGDSRAYLIRDDKIMQLTNDHSWVADRVRQGILTEDEAKHHRWRNIITNAVGANLDVGLDIQHIAIKAKDYIFICSDGISSLLTEEGMLEIISGSLPHEAVHRLIESANEAGSPDNVTAVVISVDHVSARRRDYVVPEESLPQRVPLTDLSAIRSEVEKLYPSNIPEWRRNLMKQPWYPYRFGLLGFLLVILLYLLGTN